MRAPMCFSTAVITLLVVSTMANTGSAISCGQVGGLLIPCAGYLTGAAPQPLPSCCRGLGTLKALARTTQDRRQACNCLKQAAGNVKNLRPDRASSLPAKCNVRIGVPISIKTNCATIP